MKYSKNALLVFVLLAFMYGYFYQNAQANGNSRFGLIFAIIRERRLTIDSFYTVEGLRTIDMAFYNHHYYSDKAIGTSVIGAILYAPMYLGIKLTGIQPDLQDIKYLLTFLVIGLPSAFAGSLLFVFCETITGSRLRSYLTTLAIMLGTMILPFSAVFFGHVLAGALLFISFFLIFQLKLKPNLSNQPVYLFLIGFLLGFAFLTEYPVAIIIFPLVLYFLNIIHVKWSFRWLIATILPPLIGGLIPITLMLVYNKLCFGNPLSIGYQYIDNMYQSQMAQGFMGIGIPQFKVIFYLTFHPAMGLFCQSPVLLMPLIGFFYILRDKTYRIEGIISLFAFISMLLVNSGYFLWWGGGSFAPRHLIPMLMFLGIPLAMLPKRWIPLVIILGVISFGQMLIPLANNVIVPDGYFMQGGYIKVFGYSTIYSYLLPRLINGEFNYNLGEILFGLKSWMTMLPMFLVIIVTAAIIFIIERHLNQIKTPS
jgi:hypothetical protein